MGSRAVQAGGAKARFAEPPPRILMLVPHEPEEDPRIQWVTDLCRQIGFTEVLSAVYEPQAPARVLESNLYLERAIIGEQATPRALRASRLGAWLFYAGPTQRYIRRRIRVLEAKASPERAWEEKSQSVQPRRGLLWRAARIADGAAGALLRFAAGYLSLRPLVSAMERRARVVSIVPRVVICHDLYALKAAVQLKRRYGCPIIYDSHEYWPGEDLLAQEWEVRFWTAVERRLICQADVVVTVSPHLARHLQELYALREVLSVPNAEPLAPLVQPACDRPLTYPIKFLLQGRVAPARGVEALLWAWARLDDPRATLYLRCPENEFLRQLREQFAGLVAQGRLVFLPAVSVTDLVPAATFADVGIIPYPLTTLNHVYCCPNKLSQYLQAGLAVLSTNSAFLKDVLRESGAGLTYELTTPDSFVRGVRTLLDAPQRLAEMKRNAFTFARTSFHWEKQSAPYREAIARFFHASPATAA